MNILSLARDLRRRKARERQGLFVAEGIRAVEELLRSSIAVRGALMTPSLRSTARGAALAAQLEHRDIHTEEVADAAFDSAAETESPQGILAIGVVPTGQLTALPNAESLRLLILDAIQDPGNVGTILRTAAALGVSATVALPGTVDLWNAKVVRSAMGAHFHHSCLIGTWSDVDSFRQNRDLALWAADDQLEPPPRLGLVVGNEGTGLSPQARSRANRLVALPISSVVESLNVAVATGILLYELRR